MMLEVRKNENLGLKFFHLVENFFIFKEKFILQMLKLIICKLFIAIIESMYSSKGLKIEFFFFIIKIFHFLY